MDVRSQRIQFEPPSAVVYNTLLAIPVYAKAADDEPIIISEFKAMADCQSTLGSHVRIAFWVV